MLLEADIEIILPGATEKSPEARLRIISDNAPQLIAEALQGVHQDFGG